MRAPALSVIEFWDDVVAPSIPLLRRDSWSAWRAALRALFALSLEGADLDLYRRCTGREWPPAAPAREGWFVVGRRGGKSYVMALVAVYLATVRKYDLSPGERGVLMVIAQDLRQARVVRQYIGAILAAVPMLRSLVESDTKSEVRLNSGVSIEIHTASFRSVRGYSVVGVVCDEIAFWPVGNAADSDCEILAALRPAMATTGGMLLAISTPYARKGALHEADRRHRGSEGDVLVWRADSLTMHPSARLAAVVNRAFEEDEVAAWSEYGRDGEIRYRSDVESFVSRDAVEACVAAGRRELPRVEGTAYAAFVDPAGGSGTDSFTLAVGHAEERDGQPVAVVDALREWRPPFSPEAVVRESARLLASYRVRSVVGDRYAGEWPREAFGRRRVEYDAAAKPKSDLYVDALALLNAGRVELPEDGRLVSQLVGLERRTARGGRDSVDHGPGGHDDLANVVCGLAVGLLAGPRRYTRATWGRRSKEKGQEDSAGGTRRLRFAIRDGTLIGWW